MRTRSKRFLLAGIVAMLFLYCFPYFESMRSANELPRIYLTMSMVDEGSFAIDSGVERWGKTVDMSPSGGHIYSNKAPGSSMLAVPAYLALKGVKSLTGKEPSLDELTWAFRVATSTLPTLLFLFLLWRFLGRFASDPDSRRSLIVAYGVGSMAMTYSILFIAHQLSAVAMGAAYILSVWVIEEGLRRKWLFAVGLLAGFALLTDYQAAFAGVPVAIYLLWHLLGKDAGWKARRQWISVAYAAIGAAIPVAILLWYHKVAFGSPFRTGYDASESFAHFHQQGFLGMDGFRLEALTGSTIAPDNGLLIFCPMLLLAIPGWILMFRRRQYWHLGITASVAFIYLAFISSIIFWRGGWQVGPRYVTVMLPFLMVPVAVALTAAEARWWTRGIALGLCGVGVVIYGLSNALFPHFPEKFNNPFYELILRLLVDGHAPYNAGWLIGLRGFWSLVPYLLALGGLCVWCAMPHRRHARSALVALALCVAILASYSAFPGGGKKADRAYQWVESVMPS